MVGQSHEDNSIGWRDLAPDHPDVITLREHLEANNGIRELETFQPAAVDDIVRVFRRDGFAVVTDVLTPDQVAALKAACDDVVSQVLAIDPRLHGNRGSHRYSFGAVSTTGSQLHRPEWQMLIDLPTLAPIIGAIFESDDYLVRSASGDFCLPGAYRYQPLHSDMRDWESPEATPYSSFHDPRGVLSTRDLPCPYVCVNVLTVDATTINGATRQIPGTQHSHEPFPTLAEEPEWMKLSAVCPAPAGSVQIRDVRAWHGGTPNLSDHVRSIPNIEFYAPWFREPIRPSINYADHQRLSERAQYLTRFHVVDSSQSIEPGITLNVTPPRLATPTANQ
jgi:ectoine hydroxylase-related dioxygenase (phytanoyl-CoA dioxygenase family)